MFHKLARTRINVTRMLSLRNSVPWVRKINTSPNTTEATRKPEANEASGGLRVMSLSPGYRAQLLTAMERLPSPYVDFERHCSMSRTMISSQLPPHLITAIREFDSKPSAPGALLITGLPIDPSLPSTPADGSRSMEKRTFISEGCLTGITQLIGKPFGYASEKNGEVIHNVCPVPHRETVQSNESSMVDLELHVENAYFDARPDYLALYCLRQDHDRKALTSFVDVRCALAKMHAADVAELQKPVFIVPSPLSHHEAMGKEEWSAPRPLFHSIENPDFICHFPGMKALDPQAQNALDRFEKVLGDRDTLCHIALQPGNVLLLNNRRAAHGRTSFEPRYDGVDRWLQRVYVRGVLVA